MMTRWILSCVAVILAVGCVGCATHAERTGSFEVVRAQRLELVNAEGAIYGVIEQGSNGGTVRLMDAQGNMRASIGVQEDGPMVALFSADETPKAVINLGHDGHPGFTLRDGGGKVRYDLRLREDERPCMLFWDQHAQRPRMGVGVNPKGHPNMVLFDADFNRRSWVQFLADEGPQIGVGNPQGPVWTSPPETE